MSTILQNLSFIGLKLGAYFTNLSNIELIDAKFIPYEIAV